MKAPEGLPKGYDGFLYLYPKQGDYKEYRVYLSKGLTLPSGEYVLNRQPTTLGGMLVTVTPGSHTQVNVSAIYSSYPLMVEHAFQAGEGHSGKYGCQYALKNDFTKPFLMLFPGENAVGGREIRMSASQCEDNNPFVRTSAKESSLENIDGELATYQWFSLELTRTLIKEYPDKPGHRAIDLKRLEVEHLLLEDGTRLPGFYDVYEGHRKIASHVKTQTGLDLLPGTYRIEAKGKDANGEEYYTKDEITL